MGGWLVKTGIGFGQQQINIFSGGCRSLLVSKLFVYNASGVKGLKRFCCKRLLV